MHALWYWLWLWQNQRIGERTDMIFDDEFLLILRRKMISNSNGLKATITNCMKIATESINSE